MKSIGLGIALIVASLGQAIAGDALPDWRNTASDEEKMAKIIKALPGASTLMLQMGSRYQNLYWAAKQGKWEFAEYQLEEMEDLVKTLQITRPARAATAQTFLDTMYPRILEATAAKDWNTFQRAFTELHNACMQCHTDNDHSFVVIPYEPKWAPSPVLNLEPELED